MIVIDAKLETLDGNIVWWRESDIRQSVDEYKRAFGVGLDARCRGDHVFLYVNEREYFWICRFAKEPTPEEVEATINLVKAKYL